MKYCAEQGCTTLIASGGYCDQHKRRRKRSRYKHKNKKDYNSSHWDSVRSFVYEREKGLCQRCKVFVFGKRAHTHHVIPIRVKPKLKYDPNNLRLLCPTCHVIEENELNEKEVPSYFRT